MTVDTDFAKTRTMIQTCCDTITKEFEQTWTILAHLDFNVTASCDLSGVFTAINRVQETIESDFAQTWTMIQTCCDTITKEFEQTWTILAHLDFNVTASCDLIGSFTWMNRV